MHLWGDEWFQKNGNDLYSAIEWIEKNLRKNRIRVCGKEKFGTYRDEYLCWWDGSLSQFLFGPSKYLRPPYRKSRIEWIGNIQEKFCDFIYWRIDQGWTRKMMREKDTEKLMLLIKERFCDKEGNPVKRGLRSKMANTKFYKRYCNKRKEAYNKVFQLACKKWPHLVDELISDIDGWEWVKPCRWGDTDGTEIHRKYWKPVDFTKLKDYSKTEYTENI